MGAHRVSLGARLGHTRRPVRHAITPASSSHSPVDANPVGLQFGCTSRRRKQKQSPPRGVLRAPYDCLGLLGTAWDWRLAVHLDCNWRRLGSAWILSKLWSLEHANLHSTGGESSKAKCANGGASRRQAAARVESWWRARSSGQLAKGSSGRSQEHEKQRKEARERHRDWDALVCAAVLAACANKQAANHPSLGARRRVWRLLWPRGLSGGATREEVATRRRQSAAVQSGQPASLERAAFSETASVCLFVFPGRRAKGCPTEASRRRRSTLNSRWATQRVTTRRPRSLMGGPSNRGGRSRPEWA